MVRQNVVTSVGTLVLTFNRILGPQDPLMCLLCPYDLRTARKCSNLDLET